MDNENWQVSHNEVPKFKCVFEQRKFNYKRIIKGLSDLTGDPAEIHLLLEMEKWLKQNHKDIMDG